MRLRAALLLLLAGSAAAAAPATAAPAGDFAGLVPIGDGRSLYLECRGSGSPTVLLEAGLRNRGDIWNVSDASGGDAGSVFPVISSRTRVCEYDRPGTVRAADEVSRSDPVAQPRTTGAIVRDLDRLLRAANVEPPYVMAGHSTGGLIVRQYASRYPNRVAGLVLVDAISEAVEDRMKPRQFAFYNRRYLIAASPALAGYDALETVDFYRSFAQVRRRPRPPRDVPMVVISKTKGFGAPEGVGESFADFVDRIWEQSQRYLGSLRPGIKRFIAERSGHYVQVEQPALVVKAIRRVLRLARR